MAIEEDRPKPPARVADKKPAPAKPAAAKAGATSGKGPSGPQIKDEDLG